MNVVILVLIEGIFTGDHTETVDIEYDPKIVSYAELLKMFWENHDPSSR